MSQHANIRSRLLNEGIDLTNRSRNVTYGEPIVNLTAAGELKQVMRKHIQRTDMPLGVLEALDQVLTKVARIITGGVVEDNYIDGATYFAIAGEIDLIIRQAANKIPEEGVAAVAEALEKNRKGNQSAGRLERVMPPAEMQD